MKFFYVHEAFLSSLSFQCFILKKTQGGGGFESESEIFMVERY